MKIDGRCHCGFITYEAEIDPEKVMICHCTDCQTLSGSAFRSVVFTSEDTFKLLSGELKIYIKTVESGTKRPQSFVRNAEHRFIPVRLVTVRRFTSFVSELSVNATHLHQRCSSGLVPLSVG
jgi:hypothetical protein